MESNQKTVKVRALWNIGYDGKGQSAGTVFWCDSEWAERKAGPDRHFKKKVEILERVTPEPKKPEQEESTLSPLRAEDRSKELLSVNVGKAADIINKTSSIVLLDVWREEEKANDNRKTVLEAIDKQLDRLAEGGE